MYLEVFGSIQRTLFLIILDAAIAHECAKIDKVESFQVPAGQDLATEKKFTSVEKNKGDQQLDMDTAMHDPSSASKYHQPYHPIQILLHVHCVNEDGVKTISTLFRLIQF